MLWPATISQTVGWIAAFVVLGLTLLGMVMYKRNKKSWDVVAGAPAETEAAFD